ncbi:MAG: hypothetical protein AABW56_00575 [Nanoarchaeota archaeon]
MKRITKEIIVSLEKDLSADITIKFGDYHDALSISIQNREGGSEITLQRGINNNSRIKWTIDLFLRIIDKRGRKDKGGKIQINLSHQDEYTKQELERAKNQILTKIYEFLRL